MKPPLTAHIDLYDPVGTAGEISFPSSFSCPPDLLVTALTLF